jgi:hypothetical protein
MKNIAQDLLGTLSFLNVCFIGGTLFFVTYRSCPALDHYNWTVQFGIGDMIAALVYFLIALMLGIGIFLVVQWLWRERLGAYYDRFRVVYGVVLAVVLFHNAFIDIYRNIFFPDLKAAICSKTLSDGMITSSIGLDLAEYALLQGDFFLLPDLPVSAHDINIRYYHDNFLGDYNLQVRIVCEKTELLEAQYGTWSIDEDEPAQCNEKVAIYSESQG